MVAQKNLRFGKEEKVTLSALVFAILTYTWVRVWFIEMV